MSSIPYNRDIPNTPNKPSVDQPKMKTNTNSTDSILAIDHVSFNTALSGYHKIIHQDTSSTGRTWNVVTRVFSPVIASIPNVNQIVAAKYTPAYVGATADTQLFNITGQGGISQLTGNNASTDGWAWSGGILYQWGVINPASLNTSGIVTFTARTSGIPFPNSIFTVLLTPFYSAAGTITSQTTCALRAISTTAFTWILNTSSTGTIPKIYWLAIGQ